MRSELDKVTKLVNLPGRPRSETVTLGIHAAVWDLLKHGSYDQMTMEKIAEAAGVSRPALYRRYSDRSQVTLGALLSFGRSALPIEFSEDIHRDVCLHLSAVSALLSPEQPVGKALRGVLAFSLIADDFRTDFANFIETRREPLRLRLLAWKGDLTPHATEAALDSLFGPVLYRLLIRKKPIGVEGITLLVARTLRWVSET